MLKQVTLTLDTSDPLQAQWLVEYLASPDRVRFGRACLLLGFLAATGKIQSARGELPTPTGNTGTEPAASGKPPRRSAGIGAGLFGME